jgi:hypothetical protein
MQQKLKQSALTQSIGIDKASNGLLPNRHTEKPRQEITRLVIEYSLELMTNRFGESQFLSRNAGSPPFNSSNFWLR